MQATFKVLDRYLFKEVMLSWLGATFVMLLVVLSSRIVNILADAATGKIAPDTVAALIFYKMIEMMELVSPMTFMLALVLVLGRLYKDSEMAAMMACGIGPKAIYRAIAWQTLPVLLFVCAVVFFFSPWAARQGAEVKATSAERLALSTFRPGQFLESRPANAMAYVDSLGSDQKTLGNVFIQYQRNAETIWVTAKSGKVETNSKTGAAELVLKNGYRYQGQVGNNEWKIVAFEEHGILLSLGNNESARLNTSSKYLDELWGAQDLKSQIELQWRLSFPLMVLVLGFLALPVSHTSPRKGRFGGLAIAIFMFVLYTNVLTVAKDALKDEKIPIEIGLWWVHGLMLIVGVVLFKWHFGKRRVKGGGRV